MIPYFHALFIQRHGMISALMIYGHSGKSRTILESNNASGVRKVHNAYHVRKVLLVTT